MTQWLVFSDLDGTFLDHHSYDYSPALPSFRAVQQAGIPCIWNTSKTLDEVAVFRAPLNPMDPFIVENGAAVYLPVDQPIAGTAGNDAGSLLHKGQRFLVKRFGPSYSAVKAALSVLKKRYDFKSLSEMTVEEVMACTGLPEGDAGRARIRRHTEPLAWHGGSSDRKAFIAEARDLGLHAVQGGRFLTVGGKHDKGTALLWLQAAYQSLLDAPVKSIALGDGGNDVTMLQAADVAVAIPAASGQRPAVGAHPWVMEPNQPGPQGWAESIDSWIRQISLTIKER